MAFSRRCHDKIRKKRYMHKMRCVLINRRSLLLAFRLLWKTQIFPSFFFSSRRRHTRYIGDWSSDVCSSDLGKAIDATCRQAGLGWFMSMSAVRPSTEGSGNCGSPRVPDFITRPGAYITALPPVKRLSPTAVQRWAFTSSLHVMVLPAPFTTPGPASNTVPSGRTNMNAYIGLLRAAAVSALQVFVLGS